MTRKTGLAAVLTLGLSLQAGCVSIPDYPGEPQPAPRFDPFVFFDGRTAGQGVLRKVFSRPETVLVESRGQMTRAGEMILDQDVKEGEKPVRNRQWRIRKAEDGSYAGTLTDAKAEVQMITVGNRLRINYTMDGNFSVEQILTLAADGQSAENILIVRKFGLSVAVLEETIRRLPDQ